LAILNFHDGFWRDDDFQIDIVRFAQERLSTRLLLVASIAINFNPPVGVNTSVLPTQNRVLNIGVKYER